MSKELSESEIDSMISIKNEIEAIIQDLKQKGKIKEQLSTRSRPNKPKKPVLYSQIHNIHRPKKEVVELSSKDDKIPIVNYKGLKRYGNTRKLIAKNKSEESILLDAITDMFMKDVFRNK